MNNGFKDFLLGVMATIIAIAGITLYSVMNNQNNNGFIIGSNNNLNQKIERLPVALPSPEQLPPTNQSAPLSTPTPAPSPAEQSKTTAPTEVEEGNASEETADNVEPENSSNSEVEVAPTNVAEQPKRSRKPRATYRTANNYSDNYNDHYQDTPERSNRYCPEDYPVTRQPARNYSYDVEYQQAPPARHRQVIENEYSEETFSDGSTTTTIRRTVTRRSGGTVRIIQPPITVIDN